MINKAMCFLFAMLPILLLYGWGSITFADIAILILIVWTVTKCNQGIRMEFLGVSLFFIIHPVILSLLFDNRANLYDMFGTSYRLAYYIFATGVLANQFRNKIDIIKAIRCVAVISSIYAAFQFFMANMFGVLVSTYLPFLPCRGNLDEETQTWIDCGWLVRSRSFFSEPAAVAIFLLLALSLELFVLEKNLLIVAILIGGILVSLSSLGIVCLIFLFIIFAYNSIRKGKIILKKKMLFFVGLLFLGALGCSIKINLFGVIYEHITAGGKGIMSTSRFSDVQTAFLKANTWKTFLIGNGMQDIEEYLPGWIRIYYCNGVVGLLLFFNLFYTTYKRVNKENQIVILLFALINIGSETMMGVFLIPYFVMSFYNCPREKRLNM